MNLDAVFPLPHLETHCGNGMGLAVCPALGLVATTNIDRNSLTVFVLPPSPNGTPAQRTPLRTVGVPSLDARTSGRDAADDGREAGEGEEGIGVIVVGILVVGKKKPHIHDGGVVEVGGGVVRVCVCVCGGCWLLRGLARLAVWGWPRSHRLRRQRGWWTWGVMRGRVDNFDKEPRRCHGLVGRSVLSTDTFNFAPARG